MRSIRLLIAFSYEYSPFMFYTFCPDTFALEVSTGPKFPARPAKFFFGSARPAINVLGNFYCTIFLKYYSKINIIT